MIKFKYKVGDLPAGIYEAWIDESRKFLHYASLPHFGERKQGGIGYLQYAFWDNVEFLYEIDDGKELKADGIF